MTDTILTDRHLIFDVHEEGSTLGFSIQKQGEEPIQLKMARLKDAFDYAHIIKILQNNSVNNLVCVSQSIVSELLQISVGRHYAMD